MGHFECPPSHILSQLFAVIHVESNAVIVRYIRLGLEKMIWENARQQMRPGAPTGLGNALGWLTETSQMCKLMNDAMARYPTHSGIISLCIGSF